MAPTSTSFDTTRLDVRLAAVAGLLALLFALCVWSGTLGPNPAMGAFPGGEELAADYDAYVGERVVVAGEVVGTDPAVVRLEFAGHPDLLLAVTGLGFEPGRGDLLRVYGVARPGHTVEALDAFAVPTTGRWYTWSVSFLAGLWVLGRVVSHWGLDRSDWALRARTTTWLDARRAG